MATIPRDLHELFRELELIRGHNLTFRQSEAQDTLLMMAEAALCLVTFERFLRVVLGPEATDKDTLPNLLEKATSVRLHLLRLDADNRTLAIEQIGKVRNTLQHANYEQAASQMGRSVKEYFGAGHFASEIEALHGILLDLVAQVDGELASRLRGCKTRRLVFQ